jgi:hypothetical protein
LNLAGEFCWLLADGGVEGVEADLGLCSVCGKAVGCAGDADDVVAEALGIAVVDW